MKKDVIKDIFAVLLFPLFLGLIIFVFIVFRGTLNQIFKSLDMMREFVLDFEMAGPAVFMLLQFVQVVIFVIPGEIIQIAGGYLFGVWAGTLFSIIGITAGGTFNFYAARFLGTPFVKRVMGKKLVTQFDEFNKTPNARLGYFLLFAIPGIPKDVLSYVIGISQLKFRWFLVVSTVGRLPALFASVVIGDAIAHDNWPLAIVLISVAATLFLVGVLFRKKIEKMILAVSAKNRRT